MSDAYRRAGVDIEAGDEAVSRYARHVESTHIPGVVGAFGGFGGLFDPAAAGIGPDSLLVSGTDGVGTKLKIAFLTGRHDTIGIDCVAMCVNDVLTSGSKPLFFLDYFATGRLEPAVAEAVVAGVAEGCRQAGCALLGGETAELPGFYAEGEYDLAGFAVGAVARSGVVDGSRIAAGDAVVGLPSSGFHSNGYSLLRRLLLEDHALALDGMVEAVGEPLGSLLLRPTRIYVRDILPLCAEPGIVKGMAHITGGGLLGNVPRILPDGLGVAFDQAALDVMRRPEFDWVRELGALAWSEMYSVLNAGVGFAIVVASCNVAGVLARLGEGARRIGEVVPRSVLPGGAAVDIPLAR